MTNKAKKRTKSLLEALHKRLNKSIWALWCPYV